MVVGLQRDHAPQGFFHFINPPQFFCGQGQFVQQVHIVWSFFGRLGQQGIGFFFAPAFAQQLQLRLQLVARFVGIVLGQVAHQGQGFFQASLLGKHHRAADLYSGNVLRAIDAGEKALGFRKIALLFCNLR